MRQNEMFSKMPPFRVFCKAFSLLEISYWGSGSYLFGVEGIALRHFKYSFTLSFSIESHLMVCDLLNSFSKLLLHFLEPLEKFS